MNSPNTACRLAKVWMTRVSAAILLAGLGGCGQSDATDPTAEQDPVVADAVGDPIMADPDLASQNRGNAALTGGGPASAQIPPFARSPEEIERARTAAASPFGGKIDPAPAPQRTVPQSRLAGAQTPLAVAAALGLADGVCGQSFNFSATWAAKLPDALQVYPRGHTLVAGGSDDPLCKLRAVRFVTPVAASDVIDFYFASATKAKLKPERAREGSDDVVSGGFADRGFQVYVRQRADGLTEVDLVTSGF
jgi:hypothetical protein